jgi:hypothetical protein
MKWKTVKIKEIEIKRVKRTIYVREDILKMCDSIGLDFSRFVENFLFLYLDGYSDIVTKVLKKKLKKNSFEKNKKSKNK